VKQLLGVLLLVVTSGGACAAATIVPAPGESARTLLIGVGLLLTASLTRLRAKPNADRR
jgi:hypothetical protein